ncbi:replication-associated protein [Ctenophore-associated circular virus 4]|uniref:replication-associated protein n=1 Tax=Ctenophore-associated circular virus 4 TaxID=1778561 RepID=UPI000764CEFE|nr:replication-associated protein [Ctenophore-associated circular virus 4]ALY05862.1 replication-associated protein [Ctenophore-associated circular virus 4]
MTEPTQQDTAGNSGGNTKGKRRCFAFTWNNYPEEHFKLFDTVAQLSGCKFVYQEETGENGTKHLQGALYFENARSWTSVRKLMDGWHLEVARNWMACVKYATKVETRTGDQYSNFLELRPKDPLEGKVLHPWQSDVMNLISSDCSNDRTVHWFVDSEGAKGKTSLCKHILLNKVGWLFISAGKGGDILCAVARYLKSGKKLRGVLANYSRDKEGFISYSALESIKDGLIFSTKYESQHAIFDSPHVICFANWIPDKRKLSDDRWDIRTL